MVGARLACDLIDELCVWPALVAALLQGFEKALSKILALFKAFVVV